jgi:hypothetical protein
MGSAAVVGHEGGDKNQDNLLLAPQESGTGLILDTGERDSALPKSELFLATKNAVLRQTLGVWVEKRLKLTLKKLGQRRAVRWTNQSEVTALRKRLAAKTRANCQGGSRNRRPQKKMVTKISHVVTFGSGRCWSFMPTGSRFRWKACHLPRFSHQLPSSYLSTDCIKGYPLTLMGRLVYQEELVAGEGFRNGCQSLRPPHWHRLQVLTVEANFKSKRVCLGLCGMK